MRIILIRNDGSEQDITQQVTDIEFYGTAIKELPAQILTEIAQLIAFNCAAYRAGLMPASMESASDLMDDIVGSEKGI